MHDFSVQLLAKTSCLFIAEISFVLLRPSELYNSFAHLNLFLGCLDAVVPKILQLEVSLVCLKQHTPEHNFDQTVQYTS